MRIYKLKFLSALHVDSRGVGEPETAEEFIRSDTLSAALCLSWASVFKDSGLDFFMDPPFRVSSAFPFLRSVRLYPAPVWRIWADDTSDSARKRLKAVQWISQGLFDRLTAGGRLSEMDIHLLPEGVAVSDEESAADPGLREAHAWIMSERQRVSVDRLYLPGEGGLFFFPIQFFAPDAGLWFLADGEPEVLDKLRAALDFLGDTGIGADRNSGLGHFTVAGQEDFSPPKPSSDGSVLLSLFNPAPAELTAGLVPGAAYGLTTRSGWITGTTLGRAPTRAFTEGSYFPVRPEGRVLPMINEEIRERFDLDHPAPRDFRAISLPCARPACLKEERT
jgi:CRISPR-associated protein Csm4